MSSFKIRIPFTPKAKASVRLGRHSYYNPSAKGMLKTRQYVLEEMKKQNIEPFKGPLLVVVHFRIPIPLCIPNRRRNLLHLYPHTKRPDGDNLEKFLNDALNGILWHDDSNIAWLFRSKSLTSAREGETIIYIRELENNSPKYEIIMSDIFDNINIEQQKVI